jgi:hypothetical protein
VLPLESEHHKAAHDTTDDGEGSPGCWLHPTQFDATPGKASCDVESNALPPEANTANYDFGCKRNGLQANVPTVGTSGSTSFYGASDSGSSACPSHPASDSRSWASRW